METNYETIEYIQSVIVKLLTLAGFRPKVKYEHSFSKGLIFNISIDQPKLLIGKQGANLQALQTIVFAIVNRHFKDSPEPIRFTLDIDDYRAQREYLLKQQVKESVSKLKHSPEPVRLPAMSRFERKFVHNYLQEQFPHITSSSEGQEPNRRIVMKI
ncbi:MAG TPA: R3H domain-containing nucleic acid-binding protein [Candidatus Doudnabacteria bacterium]|nr:R3H domain-containing nucleic acid-binding protein [Candidatus Doudnabacteria bacterium]